jgi:hypothetical protein
LHGYTKLFAGDDGKFAVQSDAQRERIYSEALDQLSRLHALVKQGRLYLERRLEDPALQPETSSGIAAWLGHAWQLREGEWRGVSPACAARRKSVTIHTPGLRRAARQGWFLQVSDFVSIIPTYTIRK